MELVIVILVIGILAVTIIPGLDVTELSVSAAADLMAAEVRNVQSNAIFEGTSKTISSSGGTSYIADGEAREVPGNVTITTYFSITFNALGEPVGGITSFELSRGQNSRTISIENLTGKVTITQ